jgi:uncharacterized coiled-coil DUF342 family protein
VRFHPFAEVFPLLPDAELKELAEDIKSFGLREPIWLYQGQILDGRNRWLACQRAHVEPQYRTFRGTDAGALALVVSANLKRRQLTVEQRAMAAARIATLRRGDNQHTARAATSSSQAEISEKFDVSKDSIQRAKKVIEHGSKPLQKAVEAGEVPLKKAAAVVNLPKPKQLAAAKAKPEPAADLSEFVDARDIEREEQEYAERIARVIDSDDKLKQMSAELKRAAEEIVALKQARDRYMNECAAMRRQLRAKDREIARLKKGSA